MTVRIDRKTKIGVGVVAAVLLAVAVGASGAVAVSRALDADEASQAVIDDAAGQLGIAPAELSEALREALKNRVDGEVEAGRLTEEQGDRLKERIDAGEVPLFSRGLGPPGLGRAFGRAFVGPSLEPAAQYLELSEDELRERLRDGETLADVARDEGKSVDGLVDALVEASAERLDEAVEAGRLDEERAERLEAELEEHMTQLVEGELRLRPFGPPFGRPFGLHRGRPSFAGPQG